MKLPLTPEQRQAKQDAAENAARAEQARKALEETVACSRCGSAAPRPSSAGCAGCSRRGSFRCLPDPPKAKGRVRLCLGQKVRP